MKVLMGTKQFKMVLDEEFVDRLRTAADKTGRDSAQHLAEEVLAIYLPVYLSVFDATRRAITYQTNREAEQQHIAPVVARIEPAHKTEEEMRADEIRRQLQEGHMIPLATSSRHKIPLINPSKDEQQPQKIKRKA